LAYRNYGAFPRGNRGKNAVAGRFHFDYGFVGFDFQQWLALGHLLTFTLAPRDNLAGLLRHFECGHDDADGHWEESA
jgi:hypothetical protein